MTWKTIDTSPIRTAIIGYGSMGEHHAKVFVKENEDFEMRAVMDPTEGRRKKAEEELGVRTYADLEGLLADDEIDLCIIATPSDSHAKIGIPCLRAGKHVLSEKPLVMFVEEAIEFYKAARENERLLYVGQNRRWDSSFQTPLKVIKSGELGEVLSLRHHNAGFEGYLQTYGVDEFRPQWRSEARFGGGLIYDWGSHHLDQLLQMVDSPVKTVFGDLHSYRWCEDTDDAYNAYIHFENGVTCFIEHSAASHARTDTDWIVNGTKGAFIDNSIVRESKMDEKEAVEPEPENWKGMFEDLASVLLKGTTPFIRPEQSIEVIRLINAIQLSSKEKRLVDVAEVGPRL